MQKQTEDGASRASASNDSQFNVIITIVVIDNIILITLELRQLC